MNLPKLIGEWIDSQDKNVAEEFKEEIWFFDKIGFAELIGVDVNSKDAEDLIGGVGSHAMDTWFCYYAPELEGSFSDFLKSHGLWYTFHWDGQIAIRKLS